MCYKILLFFFATLSLAQENNVQTTSNYRKVDDVINKLKGNIVNHPSAWFNVSLINKGTLVEVKLSNYAKDQLTVFSNHSFIFEVSLAIQQSPTNSPVQCYVINGQTNSHFQFSNSSGRETAMLSPKKLSAEFENYLEPPIAVRAILHMPGQPLQTMIYWPSILKYPYPPRLPGPMYPNHVNVLLFHYTEVTEVFLQWTKSCPEQWNAFPMSYEIECLTFENGEQSTQDELKCMETLTTTDSMVLPAEFESECWHAAYEYPKRVHLSWCEKTFKFLIYTSKRPEVVCRIRAHNIIGAGPWSSIFKGIHNICVIVNGVETQHNGTWTFSQYSFSTEYSLFSMKNFTSTNPSIIGFKHDQPVLLKVQNNFLHMGCYDWIGDRWYIVVEEIHKYYLSWVDDEEDEPHHIKQLISKPKVVLCFPHLERIIWSEEIEGRIQVKLQNIRSGSIDFKFKNENCSCPAWNSPLASSVIAHDLSNINYDDIRILTITSSGIWSISLNNCSCYQLLNFKDCNSFYSPTIKMEINLSLNSRLIESFAMYRHVSDLNLTEISLIVHHNQTKHLIKISKFGSNLSFSELLPVAPFMKQLSQEDLDLVPRFPSHEMFLQSVGHPVNVISHKVVHPAPPAECLFPETSIESTMLPAYTVRVKIFAHWNKSDRCSRISKPKLVYHIYYGLAGKNHSSNECDLKMSMDLRNIKKEISDAKSSDCHETVIQLKKEEYYLFVVKIEPFLGRYRDLWFKRIEPKCQVKHVFSKFILETCCLLYGLDVLLVLLLVGFSIGFYKLYKKKWYIYRRISRLSAGQVIYREEDKLGSGYFADVYKATINHGGNFCCHSTDQQPIVAAVKMLKQQKEEAKDQKAKSSFLEEAILMSALDHKNIVKPLGICLDSRPIMLAMEFMNGGSLDSYLHLPETKASIGQKEQLKIVLDVTKACSYLEKTGIIHRDLSAKNLLVQVVDHKPVIVKIGDFGLAKDTRSMQDHMYKTDSPIFPVRYTAPEGFSGTFTSKSDVWSFGVVIWEVFSWGATPFGECSLTTDRFTHDCHMELFESSEIQYFICVQEKNLSKLRDPCATDFLEPVRRIMKHCWKYDATKRPSFQLLLLNLMECKTLINRKNLHSNISEQLAEKEMEEIPVKSGEIPEMLHVTYECDKYWKFLKIKEEED